MPHRNLVSPSAPAQNPSQEIHTMVVPDINDEVIAASMSEGIEHYHVVRPADMKFMKPFARFFRLKLSKLGFADEFIADRFIPVISEIIPNAMQHGVRFTPVGINVDVYGVAPHRIVTLLVSNIAHEDDVRAFAKHTTLSEMGDHLLDYRGRGLSIIEPHVDGAKMLIYRNFSVHVVCFFKEHRASS